MQMSYIFCVFVFCMSVYFAIPTTQFKCRSRDVDDGIPENVTCGEFIRNQTDLLEKIDRLRASELAAMPEIRDVTHTLERDLRITEYFMDRQCFLDESSGEWKECAYHACSGILNSQDAYICEQEKCQGWECFDVNDNFSTQSSPASTMYLTYFTRAENVTNQTPYAASEKGCSCLKEIASSIGGTSVVAVIIGLIICYVNQRRTKRLVPSMQPDVNAGGRAGTGTADDESPPASETDERAGLGGSKPKSKRPGGTTRSRLESTHEGERDEDEASTPMAMEEVSSGPQEEEAQDNGHGFDNTGNAYSLGDPDSEATALIGQRPEGKRRESSDAGGEGKRDNAVIRVETEM